jgi:hypothetical protein
MVSRPPSFKIHFVADSSSSSFEFVKQDGASPSFLGGLCATPARAILFGSRCFAAHRGARPLSVNAFMVFNQRYQSTKLPVDFTLQRLSRLRRPSDDLR